jgi:hypothetical protein
MPRTEPDGALILGALEADGRRPAAPMPAAINVRLRVPSRPMTEPECAGRRSHRGVIMR